MQKAMRNTLYNCRRPAAYSDHHRHATASGGDTETELPNAEAKDSERQPRVLYYYSSTDKKWLPVYWDFLVDLMKYDKQFHLSARTAFRLTRESVYLDRFSKMNMSLVYQVREFD